MQTVTAPGANARTFLIHMFRCGLDDNRYVVERYTGTRPGMVRRNLYKAFVLAAGRSAVGFLYSSPFFLSV